MTSFDYNIWSKSVSFKFRCPKCGEISESEILPVPSPNYDADTQGDSEVREDFECVCKHCGHIIEGELVSGIYYGTVVLQDIGDDALIDYQCEDYEEDYDKDFGFYTDTHKALYAIDSLQEDVKKILYRLLYANAIAYMENYLCKKAKDYILRNDETIRKFIEKWDGCSAGLRRKKKDLVSLEQKLLKSEVAHYLNDLLSYHNLKKTRKLFKEILEIDLGDTDQLEHAVALRHDIVHRNGKTVDEQSLSISKQDVENVWDNVFELMKCIDSQIATRMLRDMLTEEAQDK